MSAEVTLLLTSIRCTTFVSVFFRARTQEAMEIRIYRKLIIEHLIRSVEEEEEEVEEVILPVDYK